MKQLLRSLILFLIRVLGTPGAISAQQRRKQISKPLRILLVRPDHLGDLIMTTPVLQALKEAIPQAQITMMVGPWASEVVARHPALEGVITCSFPGFQRAPQSALAPYQLLLSTTRQVRQGGYDLAINLRPDFWWGAALLYLARIPYRIGYALQPGTPFLTHSLPFHEREHATVSCLRLISTALQVSGSPPLEEPFTPERYPLHFIPTASERQWVTERLQQESIDDQASLVVIHPGTGGAVKLWRPEGWTHCANHLLDSSLLTQPVQIVLTGSKSERPLLEEIAQGITQAPLLVTDATVGQLAALLERAHLVLGVDNGPLHLAVAQKTPTVNIFGPTDVRIFGPWGLAAKHISIVSTQRCPTCPAIPCGRLDFTAEELVDHPCVRLITERQVEEAIEKLLRPSSALSLHNL